MKNNPRLLVLPLLGLMLTSCQSAVEEVYEVGEFHTQEFLDNYFKEFPQDLKSDKYQDNHQVFTLSPSDFSQGRVYEKAYNDAIMKDLNHGLISFDQLIDYFGDDDVKAIKESDYPSDTAYLNALTTAMGNSTKTLWTDYARVNNLVDQPHANPAISEYFKRGLFSKMTDGLLACDGSGPLVRTQIDEQGFGKKFDYELVDYEALTLSLRGGTNIPYHTMDVSRVPSAKINLTVSFYIEESASNDARQVSFVFPIDDLRTDDNAQTNVIHLYFDEVMTTEELTLLKRTNAMSVSFELVEHDLLKPGGIDSGEDYEFAVMMYEIMLPYSKWN